MGDLGSRGENVWNAGVVSRPSGSFDFVLHDEAVKDFAQNDSFVGWDEGTAIEA
jgi:hypothetical protein